MTVRGLARATSPSAARRRSRKNFSPGAFRDFDEWFADHLGLRYPLIYAGTGLHVGLLRRPLDRHIFFGRDGWMFWTDNAETIPATMADSRSRLRYLAGRGRPHRCQSPRRPGPVRPMRDTGFRAMSCRTSRRIYGKYLFSGPVAAPVTRLDALMRGLSEPARSIMLDSRPAMRAAAAAQRPDPALSEDRDALERAWCLLRLPRRHDGAGALPIPIDHPETLSLERYDVKSYRYAGGDMAVRVLFSPWRFDDVYVSVTPKMPFAGDRADTGRPRARAVSQSERARAVWSYSAIHSCAC